MTRATPNESVVAQSEVSRRSPSVDEDAGDERLDVDNSANQHRKDSQGDGERKDSFRKFHDIVVDIVRQAVKELTHSVWHLDLHPRTDYRFPSSSGSRYREQVPQKGNRPQACRENQASRVVLEQR